MSTPVAKSSREAFRFFTIFSSALGGFRAFLDKVRKGYSPSLEVSSLRSSRPSRRSSASSRAWSTPLVSRSRSHALSCLSCSLAAIDAGKVSSCTGRRNSAKSESGTFSTSCTRSQSTTCHICSCQEKVSSPGYDMMPANSSALPSSSSSLRCSSALRRWPGRDLLRRLFPRSFFLDDLVSRTFLEMFSANPILSLIQNQWPQEKKRKRHRAANRTQGHGGERVQQDFGARGAPRVPLDEGVGRREARQVAVWSRQTNRRGGMSTPASTD